MRVFSLSIIFLCSVLAGCAGPAKGPLFSMHDSVDKDKATVYFYRPNSDGVTVCWKIAVDGNPVGCLRQKGYIKVEFSPGNYQFFAKAAAVNFEFSESLDGGKVYYYEFDFYPPATNVEKAKASQKVSFGLLINGNHAIVEKEEWQAKIMLNQLRESI